MSVIPLEKFFKKRSKEEELLNVPIKVVVGGCGKTKAKIVELKELSMKRVESHLLIFLEAMKESFGGKENERWVKSLITLLRTQQVPDDFNIEDLRRSAPVQMVVKRIACDLIGEKERYIDNEMSPKQFAKLFEAYFTVIGYETFKGLFIKALREVATLVTEMGGVTEAKTSVGH